MRDVRKLWFVAACVLPVLAMGLPAWGATDVEVRLIPQTSATANNPPLPLETETLDPDTLTVGPADPFVIEFWVSDVADDAQVRGVIGAYVDITWDVALADAAAVTDYVNHDHPYWGFQEGVTDSPNRIVTNFGGSTTDLIGYGLDPNWVRVGFVNFTATGEGEINFNPSLGLGGFGVYGDVPGDIEYNGCTVITPEPASLALLALGGLVGLRRRR